MWVFILKGHVKMRNPKVLKIKIHSKSLSDPILSTLYGNCRFTYLLLSLDCELLESREFMWRVFASSVPGT